MIDGRTLVQMSKVPSIPGGPSNVLMEIEHNDCKYKQFLPAGAIEYLAEDGEWVIGHRDRDIVQFYANPGGLRTVAAEDIVGEKRGHSFFDLEP